ncbi:MAG: hypothetical protein ACR2GF_04895 [Acidimicrobiales bacterium]
MSTASQPDWYMGWLEGTRVFQVLLVVLAVLAVLVTRKLCHDLTKGDDHEVDTEELSKH